MRNNRSGFSAVLGAAMLMAHCHCAEPAPPVLWTRTWNGPASGNDAGFSVAVDSAGNTYVAIQENMIAPPPSAGTVAILKYDSDGNFLTKQDVLAKTSDFFANNGSVSIVSDSSDNVYVAASTGRDILVQKYTSALATVWTDTYNSGAGDPDIVDGNALAIDPAGFLILAGNKFGGNWDPLLRKYPLAGPPPTWTVTVDGFGANDGWAASAVDASGNVYAIGNPGGSNTLRKHDPNGSEIWSVAVTGREGVAANGAGVYCIGGTGAAAWIARFDFNGATIWQKTFTSPDGGNAQARGIALDTVGNLYVTGYETVTGQALNLWVRKLDSNGNEIWYDSFNGSSNSNDLGQSLVARGDFLYVAGYEDVAGQSNDVWLRKYDVSLPRWMDTGSLGTGRTGHVSVLLNNGKVLVAGGHAPAPIYNLNSAEIYDPATGTWTATGSMLEGRGEFTATLLTNGKVLVAGGQVLSGGPDVYLASAELYDPATGAWTSTGSLTLTRYAHSATLLANGKVLIAGGHRNPTISGCELYDPASGTWAATGSMAQPRSSHTATLLPNGKVLVAGGSTANNDSFASAELYDPAAGTWAGTGSMAVARGPLQSVLLPNGKVLVAGGENQNTSTLLSSAELYDPAAGTWAATGSLGAGRISCGLSLLPSGKVIALGGRDLSQVSYASAELYDSASGTWSATSSLSVARFAMTATLLPNGQVMCTGGKVDGTPTVLASAEIFSYAAGSWSATGSESIARGEHEATLLPNGKVLLSGGNAIGVRFANCELYDPSAGSWSVTGNLNSARTDHTATLLQNGKVLAAAGSDGSYLTSAEIYDPTGGTWTATGSLATSRSTHIATLLPSGNVLVAGGYNGAYLSSAEIYDAANGTWSATGSLSVARREFTATLLPNGKVLVAGGTTGSSAYTPTAELYDPSTGAWTSTGSLSTARTSHTATLLTSGKVLVSGGFNGSYLNSAELYDPANGTWSTTGSLSAPRVLHFSALLPNGSVLAAGGVTSGGVIILTAEIYDPATAAWSATGSLNMGRQQSSAASLPNGQVLVVGGVIDTGNNPTNTAELFDPGQSFSGAAQPVLSSVTNPLTPGQKLTANGSGFKGISEASGGGYQSSATNYPLLQLRSLVNEQTAFLLADPSNNWSDTVFTSAPVTGFPPGHAMATVFTNGVPSASKIILIQNGPPVITSPLTASGTVGVAFSYSITASGNPGSFNAAGLPAGLTVNTSTGVISGTPSAAGSFSVTISATNGDGSDSKTLSLTINKATPTVTWNNPADIAYPVPLSGTQLNATASVPGTFSYTPASGNVLNVGNGQTLSVAFTPTDAANFNGVNASVTINVLKGTPVVTWSNPADITFPAALGGTQLNAAANTVGSFAYTPASGTVLNAGASQALSVQFTPTDMANWNTPAAVNVAINVLKGTPVVLWSNPADITHPAALGALQLNATASVAGSFAYTPASGSVLNAGASQQLALQFTPTDTANYNTPATVNVAINVVKGTPQIVWLKPAAISYPTALTATQLNASADVAGAFVYTPALDTVLGAGAGQTLSCAFTPTDAANYNSATKTVTLDVLFGSLSLNAEPNPAAPGEGVKFTLAGADSKSTFNWDFGDGTVSTEVTPTHTFIAEGIYVVKGSIFDGVTSTTQKLQVEVKAPANRIISDFIIAPNPIEVAQEATFTAISNANAGTVIFAWDFGDGLFASGVTAKHAYNQAGEFTVVVKAFDVNGLVGTASQKVYVLAGNIALNLSDPKVYAKTIENKLNGLSVKVGDSKNAIIALEIDVNALNRDAFEVRTDFGVAGRGPVKGLRPVNKFEEAGIFIARTTAHDISTGVEKGKVRKTLAVDKSETGEPSRFRAAPVDKQIKVETIKGKFIFADNLATKKKWDAVSYSTEIELPDGYDIKREHKLSIAVGNVIDTVTVTDKGTGASTGESGRIKKLQLKYPKPASGTVLGPGQKAKVYIQFVSEDLDLKGFDTEGIVPALRADEAGQKSVGRSIQMAFSLDGVAYETLSSVQFSLVGKNAEAGQIQGRSSK